MEKIKRAEHNGDCFFKNGKEFMEMVMKKNEFVLVHGIVINTKSREPMAHCWIEDQEAEMVIDKSNGNDAIMPSRLYYAIGNVLEVKKYTASQYQVMLGKFEHWGPWELNEEEY